MGQSLEAGIPDKAPLRSDDRQNTHKSTLRWVNTEKNNSTLICVLHSTYTRKGDEESDFLFCFAADVRT